MEKFLISKFQPSPVVISGISGRFPKSRNLRELADNLYNKIDLIDGDESRWKHFNHEVPKRFGKVSGLEKFDASFFSYLEKHAATMDPQARMLLEHSYEAILDAGVCPQSLVGSRTGVFVACMASDSKDAFFHYVPTKEGLGMFGNALFYLANRISFVLGLCGPSITIDSACSGSAYALNAALRSIMTGECDAALVAGSNLILGQNLTVEYDRAGIMSRNGKSQPFDEGASGYVRSEAVCVVFLQKAKDSKRVYAEVVHVKTNNDGFKEEGSSFPSSALQEKLMKEVYAEADVDPSRIGFVEAHSTGTKAGDPQEVLAIDKVFCDGIKREKPLIIGSVKSNLGHCEAAAGVASIAKALLTFENQRIPPNINLTNLRSNVAAFKENRIKVASEAEKFDGELIAVNSFGVGGSNAHILLKGNDKEKVNQGIPSDNLNRLVLWSGRNKDAVEVIFDEICQQPLDAEFIALLHSSQVQTNPTNNFRGFGIFKQDEQIDRAVCAQKKVQSFNGSRRPIVWVFSGMGSQWPGMVSNLMNIPKFAKSIEKSHNTLASKQIDLKQIIASHDQKIFDNVLNSYVGIIAIEIALTDVLKGLGLQPDFIIGHSVGELGCAYADGCMSAEETILAAYTRGAVAIESDTIKGSMAAVGLHHTKVLKMLPDDIDIACHNGSNSTTISGPTDSIKNFVNKLESEKVFVKEVESSGVAFHSRYVAEMGEKLLKELKTVIKSPRKRSSRWLSSTFDNIFWDEAESQLSSAEYHTKNLLNPVLFEEVCKMLPANSLCVEIGPHGLLKPIMKMNLSDGISLSLMQRGEANGSNHLMEALGNLFTNGIDIDIAQLYPPVQFPVSRGTPMISPILKWNHDDNHFVPYFDSFSKYSRRNLTINLSDKNFEFMKGHIIGDRVLFPAAGWIVYVWQTYAMMLGKSMEKLKIVIDEIKFLKATVMVENRDTHVTIAIHRASGSFEVSEGDSLICEGEIKAVDEVSMTHIKDFTREEVMLNEDDIYKICHLVGHRYQGAFRDLSEVRSDRTKGKVNWKSNWITFIDALIVNSIAFETTYQNVPVRIRKVVIDPKVHFDLIVSCSEPKTLLDLKMCPLLKIIQSGGVELHDVKSSTFKKRCSQSPSLEGFKFVPYFPEQTFSLSTALKIFLQLIQENMTIKKLSVLEIDSNDNEDILSREIVKFSTSQPGPALDVTLLSSKNHQNIEGIQVVKGEIAQFAEVDVVIVTNIRNVSTEIKSILNKNGFIICRNYENSSKVDFDIISKLGVEDEFLFLLKVRKVQSKKSPTIEITSNVDEWLGNLKVSLNLGPAVVFSHQEVSGIVGLVNCIRKEPFGEELKCFSIEDKNAPKFDIQDQFYKFQFEFGLVMNVIKQGKWGSYRHLELIEDVQTKPRSDHVYADCLTKGDLSTLSWIQGSLDVDQLKKREDFVTIYFAALNFRDIMYATAKIVDEREENAVSTIGYEFSGVTSGGQQIMGCTHHGGLMSSHCATENSIFWNVPNDWTLQQAATVPIGYLTVYLAFFKHSQIKKGKTVMIHAGSGGVGQAAIRVALAYGLEVFTTVSTDKKKQFLLEKFPKLKEENIGNSRDDSFEQMIQINTKGRGVDFVLNCLSGELLQASLRCVSTNGSFLEIGKFDIQNETKIHLGHFGKQINFQVVLIDELFKNEDDLKFVHGLIERDIKFGVVHPINSTVFDAADIQDAFKFMGGGKHIGKILLRIRENENEMLPVRVISRVHFKNDETVVIVGGLGGFGMELAGWLVSKGCNKLVLCSRSGVTNGYQAFRIKHWKSKGVEILISRLDLISKSGCSQMIDDATQLGPIAAILNLAGVLRDRIFENQTVEAFNEVLAPKAEVTRHLDEISRLKCPTLKHFVVFSSLACGRGNAGQSNYGMANSIMEQIIELRREQGLPGKAIQWGAIGDVGMLAKTQNNNKEMEVAGTNPQEIASCLEVLDSLLTSHEPIVSSMVVAKKSATKVQKKNIVNDLMYILSVGNVEKSLAIEKPLVKFGIDSLTTVEIQQLLERDYDTVISSNVLRMLSIRQIKEQAESMLSNNALIFDIAILDDIKFLANTFGDENTIDQVVLKGNDIEDASLPTVLIAPGIFGSAVDVYLNLASKLKFPAYILQLHKAAKCTRFDDMIEIIKYDVLNLVSTPNFILIGHSFGSQVCLKLASFLERNGKIGHLVSIDGSPKWSYDLTHQLVNSNDRIDIIETWALKFFIKAAFMGEAKSVIKEVFTKETWDSKLEKLYEHVKSRYSYSFHYLKTMLLNAIVYRTRMSLHINKITFPVLANTKITLVKASEIILKDIDEDYNLKQYSLCPFTNKTLEGSHITVIANPYLPEIINKLV